MKELPEQMLNNLSFDEIENEVYVRGIENVNNKALSIMLNRSMFLHQEFENTIDDLNRDNDELTTEISDIENRVDDVVANVNDNNDKIESFLTSGDFIIEDLTYMENGAIESFNITPMISSNKPLIYDYKLMCARLDNDLTIIGEENPLVLYFPRDTYDHNAVELKSESIVCIKKEILPYVIVDMYKELSKRINYD